ncbi:poly-gamma-glutamate hydrolase family protein [Nostoc sp. CHAB 5784]|uniref:poly-gamma-glutamate hydrolase family protein n=1 Tax=Nostoc mirabile TaxID=2907820 RepID=UPI001E44F475|nr:poly-gamma-glutamate hydrolase family protein [Nostoc mirabile]MCC5668319.1 poly-gamma-glutamate hydrolase family protein [Nostoc mirabile CHAB5784]
MENQYFKRLLCILLGTILIIFTSLALSSPVQADDFGCFEKGANSEQCKGGKPILANSCSGSNSEFRCCEGDDKDYDISSKNRNSDVTVLAIHGGLIEPDTSFISRELADRYKWNYYIFSGHGREQCLKGREGSPEERNFKRLHITSTRFNHQKALDLVSSHPQSVAIHGYNPKRRKYPKGVICVGGKNESQVEAFINYVKVNSSIFTDAGGYELQPINAAEPKDDDDGFCIEPKPPLSGINKFNIVNRNCTGKGLQLELSNLMRADLANEDELRFKALDDIIYGAIKEAMDISSSNCSESMESS